MTRPTTSEKQKQLDQALKRKHKLNSLKNEFEGGKISSFDQVFAIFSETALANELGISFYTFGKKIQSPGEFSIYELMKLANLIGTQYEIIHAFILQLIAAKRNVKPPKLFGGNS